MYELSFLVARVPNSDSNTQKGSPAWKPDVGVVHFRGITALHSDDPQAEGHLFDTHSERKHLMAKSSLSYRVN